MKSMMSVLTAVAIFSALAGCAAIQQNQAAAAEQTLAEAGFRQIPGDTKPRIDALRSLKPRSITAVNRDGQLWYVYADPTNCACLYIGNPSNYQAYQRLAAERQISDEQIMANEDTVLGWSEWGPWY